ncbi:hypothetical protein Csa_016061 [Cucumis sativus]|uniref:Uncharacterized protein n=1 Tax=Cucumis sativus TaxID=3659 RepID=A0A0A0KBU5_CUCSA|nr:hypothetical protein Csa_016061 [Cucumis sativus]
MGIAAADLVLQVSGFLEWTPSMVAAWLIFLSGPQSAVRFYTRLRTISLSIYEIVEACWRIATDGNYVSGPPSG